MVVLNPGLSFGTGHHPTTRFCLEQIASFRRSGPQSFLDLGTGSGILAISAVKLGYSPVEAVDLDPEAVRIAARNARSNRVAHRIRLGCHDVATLRVLRSSRFDLVCANLIYDVLLEHRSRIANSLRAGGRLILAGILRSQFREVGRAYRETGLKLVLRQAEGEWESGAFSAR